MNCRSRRNPRISVAETDVRSRPSNLTLPEVGSISLNTRRPNVLFPEPDSPTRPSVSPATMSSETSSTARTSPLSGVPNTDSPSENTFTKLRISISATNTCRHLTSWLSFFTAQLSCNHRHGDQCRDHPYQFPARKVLSQQNARK